MEVLTGVEPEDLVFEEEIWLTVREAAAFVAAKYEVTAHEVSITLTDDTHIQEINRLYRGLDRPTDVISFALDESDEPEVHFASDDVQDLDTTLGDILISVERAKEQASLYGHSLRRELAFLTVHGMLHLLGYDHIEEADRTLMEAEQEEVMVALGIGRE